MGVEISEDLGGLSIVKYPDPVLRKVCAEVAEFSDGLGRLAERMLELMRQAQGIGLAAPQVGFPVRMFVYNVTGEEGDDGVWVNPKVVEGEGAEVADEGCLSLPQVLVPKRRAVRVVVEGFGLDGSGRRMEAEGLLARVWQHEADHLDGVLIIDAMPESAELANRRILRQLEEDFAAAKR